MKRRRRTRSTPVCIPAPSRRQEIRVRWRHHWPRRHSRTDAERIDQSLAISRAGQVTAIDQQVGIGVQRVSPRCDFACIAGSRVDIQSCIAELDAFGVAMTDEVNGIDAGELRKRLGDLHHTVLVCRKCDDQPLCLIVTPTAKSTQQRIRVFDTGIDKHHFQRPRRHQRRADRRARPM